MKHRNRFLALLLALALCFTAGCSAAQDPGDGADGSSSDAQENPAAEDSSDAQDTPDAEDGTASGQEDGDEDESGSHTEDSADTWDPVEDPGGLTSDDSSMEGVILGTTEDLKLTQVDDLISTITYRSTGGVEMTMPVSNRADWEVSLINADLTSVDVYTEGRCLTMSYYSVSAADYDLEEATELNLSIFAADGGELEQSAVVTSADGKTSAQAIYGVYGERDICQVLVTSNYDDELAVLDMTLSDQIGDVLPDAQAILDHLGVGTVLDGLPF